jgi:hypothetical protein
MKKKSTSHVVQLKERTKERIRKAQGPSSTPKTERPALADALPAGDLKSFISMIPDDMGPQTPEEAVDAVEQARTGVSTSFKTFSPVLQHHGTQNDLARQIISKVPATKLDPNSEEAELARLLKHQMPVKKKDDAS